VLYMLRYEPAGDRLTILEEVRTPLAEES